MLPVIGGTDFDALATEAFMGDRFQRAYVPGQTLSCYVAANASFRTPNRTMRPPMFKIGLVSSSRLYQRQIELDQDGYGSMIKRAGEPMRDPTFGAWDLLRMPTDLTLSPSSPVAIGARDLRIKLPVGLDFPQFDARLTAALAPAALNTWAASAAGVAYCQRNEIDVDTMLRFTSYEFGTGTRLSPATEIYIFRPKTEMRRLALLIESIIVDWVMAASL